MVRVARVGGQAVGRCRGIPITAEVSILCLAQLVSARGGVYCDPPASSGVVVTVANVQSSGIL